MLLKIVKGVAIAAVLLVAVLIGIGLLLSPRFTVARNVLVAAPPDKVYALIAARAPGRSGRSGTSAIRR